VTRHDYQQRLAGIEAAVARARLEPAVLVARASGVLAGRVGCSVDDAHAYLLRRALTEGRTVEALAADILDAADAEPGERRRLAAALDAMSGARPAPSGAGRRPPSAAAAGPDWAGTIQQVLDSLSGSHLALLPERDDAGEVVDFRIVAVSPETADFSGRPAAQMVGLRMSDSYPSIPDQIRRAWLRVLTEGRPQQVGPLSYVGAADRSPVDVMITARLFPVGPGVLASWIRHDEQNRLVERIAQTERLGSLGWGEADLVTGRSVWSEEMYRIHERDPALGPMTGEEQDALTLPEDAPIRRRAVESFGRGETVDMTYRVRINEKIKYLRAVVEASRDGHGRPVKIYGIVQDITAQETSRRQLAEAERLLHEQQRKLAAEHRLATHLQQIVLPVPAEPFDLADLRVAVRYLPAGEAGRVGGDWFHAATAYDGSVVLAVGDVAGHGIHAATVMAQLRYLLAGLTLTTTSEPDRLLWHLNRLLYDGGTATAVVARYNPASRQVIWAQAGHPPPLHARAGRTTVLARPHGTLLGADLTASYDIAAVTLEAGDLLLFYTDGLVERRSGPPDAGLPQVIASVDEVSAAPGPDAPADLLSRLRSTNPDDDTCILAVHHRRADSRPPAATG
jgi:serine phosphatase RsbU (regulator of sigma subunit)